MALDIRSGDILVVGSQEYSILVCGPWSFIPGSTAAMNRICNVTASTKRKPDTVAGQRGDAATQIASMKCTPVDPISGTTKQMVVRDIPKAPTDLYETIANGGDMFYALVVEKIKK